jgi:amidase
LKDIGCTEAGRKQEQGSRLMEGFVSDHDSFLMTRFKEAGLVNLGRTTTPEFALSSSTESVFTGDTHNPWARGRMAGGPAEVQLPVSLQESFPLPTLPMVLVQSEYRRVAAVWSG